MICINSNSMQQQTWATLEALALAFENTTAAAVPANPYYYSQAHIPAGAAAFGLPNPTYPSTASAWGAERYMAAAAAAAAGAGAAGYGAGSAGGYSASAAAVYGLPMPGAAGAVGQPLTYGPAGGTCCLTHCLLRTLLVAPRNFKVLFLFCE